MKVFFCQPGYTYRIFKDPDDVLTYGMQWYEVLRGSDDYWKPRVFVRPGEIRTPSKEALNGHRYVATRAGTTAAREPEWLTEDGAEVSDGGVIWTELGAEDRLATSTWDAGGLTPTNDVIDTTGCVAQVTLAGLEAGQEYTVTNSIISVQGKHKDQSFTIVVRQN